MLLGLCQLKESLSVARYWFGGFFSAKRTSLANWHQSTCQKCCALCSHWMDHIQLITSEQKFSMSHQWFAQKCYVDTDKMSVIFCCLQSIRSCRRHLRIWLKWKWNPSWCVFKCVERFFLATCYMWWKHRKYIKDIKAFMLQSKTMLKQIIFPINISLLLILWEKINKSNGSGTVNGQ